MSTAVSHSHRQMPELAAGRTRVPLSCVWHSLSVTHWPHTTWLVAVVGSIASLAAREMEPDESGLDGHRGAGHRSSVPSPAIACRRLMQALPVRLGGT